MATALLLMATQMTSAPVPSMKLKLKKGAHLVHGVRMKTTWFVNNIAKTHPVSTCAKCIVDWQQSYSAFHRNPVFTSVDEGLPILSASGHRQEERRTPSG